MHRGIVLRDAGDVATELDTAFRLSAKLVVQDPGELELLGLETERMPCRVGDCAEIECRDHAVAGAELQLRGDKSLRDQRRGSAEFVEHVERGRMKGRGAQFF